MPRYSMCKYVSHQVVISVDLSIPNVTLFHFRPAAVTDLHLEAFYPNTVGVIRVSF
jgi:hypothetical protein